MHPTGMHSCFLARIGLYVHTSESSHGVALMMLSSLICRQNGCCTDSNDDKIDDPHPKKIVAITSE